ncbi:MAG: tetratricopeptide repeat protein [Ferruginibacter sp.]|nr:tetratricopeptide repeat protein [Ferruginibacter sp.]
MKKINSVLLILTALLLSTSMKAQTIEEGKKFMYYERYQSAKNSFQKLIAANPANIEAVYRLGLATMAENDYGTKGLNEAKELYRKALVANPNNPLLIAGMGMIELREGKSQDARNRFETALSLSQNKDLEVLLAVGMANSDFDNKYGDPNYAIEKLKLAASLKKVKEPAVYIYMGDAYRKLMDGGNAQISYQSALNIDPNYARAQYRIGKIYQTQGMGQEEIYMKYFNEAIAKDPAYAPVYKNLSDLYYNTDVTKSGTYLDKYLSNTDEDPKNCYYRASMKYAQGLFQEAISMADQCIAKTPNPYSKLYGIQGYAFNRLGDSLKAKSAFENYFKKADSSQIGMGDYATYANVLLKFPDNDSLAGMYVTKAVQLDTLEANKITYLKNIASYYEGQKKFKESADWYNKVIQVKKEPSKTDLYYAGYNYFRSGHYQPAIDIFNIYGQKFPDDPFSYYMIGKSYWAIDSTMAQGLANPSFQKAIEVGQVDKVKYKSQLIGSYKYFVAYFANIKKDKATAISYCDSVLAIDPADTEALTNKTAISSMNMNAPAQQPKQTNKPAGTKPAAEKSTATTKPAPAAKK